MAGPEPGIRQGISLKKPPRRRWRRLLLVPAALWLGLAVWHTHKPLPEGVHVEGALVATPGSSLQFLADVTAADAAGNRVQQQTIHAATLELVRNARDFLVLDYFLFNGQGGPRGPLVYEDGLAPVSTALADALRELKQAQPTLPVLLLVDPINDYYRGTAPPALAALEALGVDVAVTRLDGLRDSNPVYSATWRMLFAWWLDSGGVGAFPNLLDGAGPRLKPGALLRLPNFKANHRKVVLTGDGAGSLVGIVSSGNPHDASSAHSNVALRVEGEALRELLGSELSIARQAGASEAVLDRYRASPAEASATGSSAVEVADDVAGEDGPAQVGILTEGAIRVVLLQELDAAGAGDAIDLAQFYLSDQGVLDSLLAAARRGAAVRLLLDPNRDAFGFSKSGIPNRPLASALARRASGTIALRWYRTHGEQFHSKFAMVRSGGRLWFTLGSANFTRRNIADYNLEANVQVECATGCAVALDAASWFERLWSNAGGIVYSDEASRWAEDSHGRYLRARVMEATGLSTF
ncbi:MAG TPA: phospholipase D-like domain-containing protein [Steroidobacteraceae bacterium]|nr:phospholipase D-like domain-containing protein [Steroidobacteraceae bacterium]